MDTEKELRELKKRLYIENGVYLYKCERCEHLVALHQESCSNCKTLNSFYERPERPILDEFMTEVELIYMKKDLKKVEVKRKSPKMSDDEKLGP